MMDVAPVRGGGAAGEHAVPVAPLDRPADVRRTTRWVRPTSRGCPSGPITIREITPSQASQRARAAEIRAPNPVRPAPGPVAVVSVRSSASMATITCGFCVRSVGRVPAASWLSHSCTSASAFCCARVRSSPSGRVACTIDSIAASTFSPPTASRSNRPVPQPSACRTMSAAGPRSGPARRRPGPAPPGRRAPPAPAGRAPSPAATASSDCSIARQVHALLGGGRPRLLRRDRRDHRDLPRGDRTRGERRRGRRQVLQRPPDRTIRAASAGVRCPCPRSHDAHRFSPSCSAARSPRTSRTVRVDLGRRPGSAAPATASRSSTCGPNIGVRSSAARASSADCNSPTGHLPSASNVCSKSTARRPSRTTRIRRSDACPQMTTDLANRSGVHGEEDEAGQQHQVHPALQPGRPGPGTTVRTATTTVTASSTIWVGAQAEHAAARPARWRRSRWPGWSGRCWPSPSRSQVEADLHPVAAGGA